MFLTGRWMRRWVAGLHPYIHTSMHSLGVSVSRKQRDTLLLSRKVSPYSSLLSSPETLPWKNCLSEDPTDERLRRFSDPTAMPYSEPGINWRMSLRTPMEGL